jgi:hypothetical protein
VAAVGLAASVERAEDAGAGANRLAGAVLTGAVLTGAVLTAATLLDAGGIWAGAARCGLLPQADTRSTTSKRPTIDRPAFGFASRMCTPTP